MMSELLTIGFTNAVVASVIGVVVVLLGGFRPRPALLHALWLLVLLKLLAPPLLPVSLPWLPAASVTPSEPRLSSAADLGSFERGTEPQDPRIENPVPAVHEADQVLIDEPPGAARDSERDSGVATADRENRDRVLDVAVASAAPPVTITPAANRPRDATSSTAAAPRSTFTSGCWSVWSLLATVWLCGSLACAATATLRIARFHRLLRRAVPADPELVAETRELCEQLGIPTAPLVVTLPVRLSPAVWPLGRRLRLVLPAALVGRVDRQTISALIAHELIHIRRRDHWVRGIELLASCLYWWHPFVWWARRELRRAEEDCCDSWVVHRWPQWASAYARGLLEVVGFLSGAPEWPAPASGLGQLKTLERRVRLILGRKHAQPRLTRAAGWGLALAAALLLPLMPGLVRRSASQPPEKPASETLPVSVRAWSEDNLPIGCEPQYRSLSPDGRFLAYAGWFGADRGERKHALYLVDLASGQVRQLLATSGLKRAPAWSPDSKRLALGNAAGYRSRYPLVIIDVASGEVEQTGVEGVGAAWSPDGRHVALTMEVHQAGGWVGGIPADGRIGVWDTQHKTLTPLSPPGYNVSDDRTGGSVMIGALRPLWSPDSRHIAYVQRIFVRQGSDKSSRLETWMVNRKGSEVRRVFDHANPVRWSQDSLSLIDETTQERAVLAGISPATEDEWPAPSAQLLAAIEQVRVAELQAARFDARPILERNRAWQNPTLDGLTSVRFTHRMRPVRLDERFAWRSDGAAVLEVVYREDDNAEREVGRLHVTTPDLQRYTLRPGTRYPTSAAKTREEIDDYVRSHLMGTRATFTALDWGRTPQRFKIRDVRHDTATGHLKLELVRRDPRDRHYLNAGAMFETTSWAYVHHVQYSWCELTIDAGTHRILREVDFSADGSVQCEITFDEWIDVAAGQSVPGRIQLHFPSIGREPRSFDVDYRFQWLPEGLWILKSGESRFADSEPQLQEIVDLEVNQPLPDLQAQVARLRDAANRLAQPAAVEPQPAPLPLHDLRLGQRYPLRWPVQLPAQPAALRFTIEHDQTRYREIPGFARLLAVFSCNQAGADDPLPAAGQRLLVLYDDQGRPLTSARIPLAALALPERPAAELLARIAAHNRLWLAPSLAQLPDVDYTFHLGEKTQRCSLHDRTAAHYYRGVTLGLALDDFLAAPGEYQAPIVFDAQLDQRDVTVAVLVGRRFGRVFGNGIHGGWRGYSVATDERCLLVFDSQTGCPLVSRHSGVEVRFLNCVEVEPGQFVPLRIVVFDQDDGIDFDFRFQVVGGKVWLFDHSVSQAAEISAFVDQIEIAGENPDSVERLDSAEALDVEPFDWTRLTNRTIAQDAENAFVREVVSRPLPFTHPQFTLLGQLATSDGEIKIDLGRSPVLRHVRHWTLGDVSAGGEILAAEPAPAIDPLPRARQPVELLPFRLDEELVVAHPSDSGSTRLRSLRFEHNQRGELLGRIELVSQYHWTELVAYAEVTLLDEDDQVCASAGAVHTFHILDSVYDSDVVLNFGRVAGGQPRRVQVGLRTVVIGQIIGSTWGRFADRSPLFPVERLLGSDDRTVWSYGLVALNEHLRDEVLELSDFVRDSSEPLGNEAALALRNHAPRIAELLARAADADDLVWLCLLAGYTKDTQFVEPLAALAAHEDAEVRDAAAIGLGLSGDARGQERIRQVLERPLPEATRARRRGQALRHDAARALRVLSD